MYYILSSLRFLTYYWSWWLCRPNYFSIFQSRWWFVCKGTNIPHQVHSFASGGWDRCILQDIRIFSVKTSTISNNNVPCLQRALRHGCHSQLDRSHFREVTHTKSSCYYYHSIFYIERLLLNCHNISLQKRELAPHSLSKRANILAKCIRYIFYTSYPRFVVIVYPYHSRSLCTLGNCR